MADKSRWAAWGRWWHSPLPVLLGVGLGVALGVLAPAWAAKIKVLGEVYLALLKLCVLPILLAAVTMSVSRLAGNQQMGQLLQRLLLVFVLGLVGVSGLSVLVAAWVQPGVIRNPEVLAALGRYIQNAGVDVELALQQPATPPPEPILVQFVRALVPDNIFAALTQANALQVVTFAVLLGITLGLLNNAATARLGKGLEGIYEAFNALIRGITRILPLGIFCLIAPQVGSTGVGSVLAILRFVVTAVLVLVGLFIAGTAVMGWRCGRSPRVVWQEQGAAAVLSWTTSNSLAALPAAIQGLCHLGWEREQVNLITPLAITVCRFGVVSYFALVSVFTAQLYQQDLTGQAWLVLVLGAVLGGVATAGAVGVATLASVGIVLQPLGLPLDGVLTLLIAVDPIVNPFRALVTVHGGMVATTLIAKSPPHPGIPRSAAVVPPP
ncbi:MAG: cation:dicarboxylase symporter family transporter [Gloeomargarita sp. DG02_4_bins_56]